MMGKQTPVNNIQGLITEAYIASLWEKLDELHGLASEGKLHTRSTLSGTEMLNWLHEMLFVVQETIDEVEAQAVEVPELKLVK